MRRLQIIWSKLKGQAAQHREDSAFVEEIREHLALLEQRTSRRAWISEKLSVLQDANSATSQNSESVSSSNAAFSPFRMAA